MARCRAACEVTKSVWGLPQHVQQEVKLNLTQMMPIHAISDNLYFYFLPSSSATGSLSYLTSFNSLLDYVSVEESGV